MNGSDAGRTRGDAVSIGETMLYFQAEDYGLLRYSQKFQKYVGGTESNTMMALSKLGFDTAWVSRLGADEFGYNIRDFIRGEGVDVSRVIFDPKAPTGVFFVEKNANDETRSLYYRAGSAASRMRAADLDLDYFAGYQYLHLTGITTIMSDTCRAMVDRLIREAKKRGMTITLDPNLRLRMAGIETFRETLSPLFPMIDVFLPSEHELVLLMDAPDLDQALDRARDLGLRHVVVKKAGAGSLLCKDGATIHEPAFPVKKVISSMAAGDAFNAGYLAGLLKGLDEVGTLRLANCLGAMATMAWGPYESLPDWPTVMAYLEGPGIVQR